MRWTLRSLLLSCCTMAVVGLGVHRAARACSCLPPPPPAEAAEDSTMVFEGRPGPPIQDGARVRYRFSVERVFKGSEVPEVEIFTAASGASCGRTFQRDEKYLVYAYDYGGGRLGDGLCSRTRPSSNALADLSELGPGTKSEASEPAEDAIASEPPRIAAARPPPASSSPSTRRGCTLGELPHAPETSFFLLVGLLGIAASRRSPVG